MADSNGFDANKYFSKMLGESATDLRTQAAKLGQQVAAAKEQRVELLKNQEALRKTWVDQAGLNTESFTGQLVNNAASVLVGLGRGAAYVSNFAPDTMASMNEAAVPQAVWEAYNRHKQGKATAADNELLSAPLGMSKAELANNPDTAAFYEKNKGTFSSALKFIENQQATRNEGRALAKSLDFGEIVDQRDKEGLTNTLKTPENAQSLSEVSAGWGKMQQGDILEGAKKMLPGLGSLIFNAGEAAVDNPMGALNYVSENLPQLVVGAFGKGGKMLMGQFNAGYAIDNYQQGIDNYKKANQGQMPSAEVRQQMAIAAAEAGMAEHLGDTLALGVGKAFSKAGQAAGKSLGGSAIKAARDVGFGVVNEGATEGLQTYLEGQAQLKPASAMDIYQGAAIGAASGGGIAAGLSGAGLVGEAASVAADKLQARSDTAQAPSQAVQDAFKSKSVDALLDQKSADYSPSDAISVLHKLSFAEGTTPEEKLAYQEQAKQVLDKIQLNAKVLNQGSSENIQGLQQTLAELRTMQAAVPSTDTQARNDLAEQIGMIQESLAEARASQKVDPKAEARIKAAETAVIEAKALYESMLSGTVKTLSETDVPGLLTEANQSDRTKAEASVQKAVILSMVSPDLFTADNALELADNTGNALTEQERSYLRSYAAAARMQEELKGLSRVNREIVDGDVSVNQKGLQDYQARFGRYASSNDAVRAGNELKGLNKFLTGQKAKAVALTKAFKEVQATGKAMQVTKDANGVWQPSVATRSMEAVRADGGFFITKGSQSFVKAAYKEAQAISLTYKALSAGYELRFNKPQSQAEASNVGIASDQAQQSVDLGSSSAQASASAQTQTASDTGVDAGTNTSSQPASATNAVEANGVVNAADAQSQVDTAPVDQGASVDGLVQPVAETEPATVTTDEAAAIETALAQAEKAYRRVVRNNPASLYSAVKDKLTDADLFDIYGNEWKKRFTALKGKNGRPIIDMVTSGELDAFLPAALRFGQGVAAGLEAEQQAVEVIKEKLRNRDYLTDDTNNALAQLDVTIQELEAALSTQDIIDELDQATQRLKAEQELGSGQSTAIDNQAASGSVDSTAGTQDVVAPTEGTTGSQTSETESTSVAESNAGALAALDRSNPDNPLAAWLKQSAGKTVALSKRPLVLVKDFLSSWTKRKVNPEDFVSEKLTPEQKVALQKFFELARGFFKEMPATLARNKNTAYAHQNPGEFFMTDEDGKLKFEQNVIAAMAVAAMTKITDMVTLGLENNDEAINSILGRSKEMAVSKEARDALGYNMVRRAVFADALGKQVIAALGLKAEASAPVNLIPNLEASLGAYAMALLAKQGLISFQEIQGPVFEKLAERKAEGTSKQDFVQIKTDKYGQLSTDVQALVNASKGSKNILEKLFSVEQGSIAPTLEAVPFNQARAKDSKMRVPSWLAERLDKMNKVENRVNTDVFTVMAQMQDVAPELVEQMAGIKEVDPATTHAVNAPSIKAKNEGLRRELANFMSFVSDDLLPSGGLSTPFFFQHSVWKNQRVGILNNLVNPQTSKIHRYLITRNSWATDVALNNASDVENFKLRVLEGFGVKTEKAAKAEVLKAWDSKVSTPEVKAAVQALQSMLQGNVLTAEQSVAVANGVAQAKEKFHSLNALVALAKFQAAQAKGESTVTVTLTGEVDGVTNGPMLSHLLLGAAATVPGLMVLLNKGGFFEQGNNFTNFGPYRGSQGVMDLYETVASKIIKAVNASNASPELLNAIWAFTGQLEKEGKVEKAGRDIVKTPITALMFGSSVDTIVSRMTDSFVESIYSAIEDVAKDKQDSKAFLKSLNTLLGAKMAWPLSMTPAQMLRREFTAAELSAISGAFFKGLGEPTSNVMNQEFAAILERRNHINKSAKFLFELYDSAYQRLRGAKFAELVAAGQVEVDGAGKPIWELTQAQEQEIRKKLQGMDPRMHSVMSLRSNDRGAGLMMADTETKLSTQPLYNNVVRVSGFKSNTMSINAQSSVATDPGVTLVSASTHSADSGISHEAAPQTDALNIHDAHVVGLGAFEEAARNLNLGTWNTMVEYSPLHEMYTAMERAINGMVVAMQDPAMAAVIAPAIKSYLQAQMKRAKFKGTPETFLIQKLSEAKFAAYQADTIRLGALAQMQSIDQYAMEGGQHTVTQAQRDDAQARLDALTMELPSGLVDQVMALGTALQTPAVSPDAQTQEQKSEIAKAIADLKLTNARAVRLMEVLKGLDNTPSDIKGIIEAVTARMVGTDLSLEQAVETAMDPAKAVSFVGFLSTHMSSGVASPIGTLGTPLVAAAPGLVAMFESQPEMSGKDLIKQMVQHLSGRADNQTAVFYRKLLGMAYRAMGDEVKVVYVKADTDPSTIDKPKDASRGWYSPKTNTIYVLSDDFINSGVNSEVLSHELVHAALFAIVENPTTPTQKQIVQELNALMGDAAKFIADNNIKMNLESGVVSNIHEFIAYGMTSREFQTKVLAKMRVPAPKGQFITAMQDFINKLVGLLFNKAFDSTAEEVDGFTALLANVTGLYQEAANQEKAVQQQKAESTNNVLSMAAQPVVSPVTDYTTEQVFAALDAGNTSGSFQAQLAGVLEDIVNTLHGPFGAIKTQVEASIGKTAQDVWAHLQVTGQRPFAAKVLNANVVFSQKETYVAEQVEAVMSEVLGTRSSPNSVLYREIEKLYQEAKEKLKGKIDADLYRFVFFAQTSQGNRSDYMSRFVALALSNQEFNQLLSFKTQELNLSMKGKTFMERLEQAWRAAVDWLGARLTGTYMGQEGNTKLNALVSKLVEIETRTKEGVKEGFSLLQILEPADDKASAALGKAKKVVAKFVGQEGIRNNRFAVVRAVGSVADIYAKDRVSTMVEGINRMRDQAHAEATGAVLGLVNYVGGIKQWANALLLASKQIDKTRMEVVHDTASAVMAGFANNGEDLTADQKKAVSAVMLRTGMHKLLGSYTLQDIQAMLEDKTKLDKAVADEVAQLETFTGDVEFYITQAKGLGFFKATGEVAVDRQMMNAGNIARLYGSGKAVPSVSQVKTAEAVLERLITLYSLSYSEGSEIAAAAALMAAEGQRGPENGIEVVLKLTKHLEVQAKERNFDGAEALMIHGYTSEILNQKTTFSIARSPEEAEALENKGYTFHSDVGQDKADFDTRPAKLYVLRGGGLSRRLTGMVSFRDLDSKGADKTGLFAGPGGAPTKAMQVITGRTKAKVDAQFKPNRSFDPRIARRTEGNKMLPTVNAEGKIVGYRYVMSERMKDTLLQRDNRFDHILGTMAGATYDKVATAEQNRKVLLALKQHFNEAFSDSPLSFIQVHSSSQDPRMKELWDLLPAATKADIKAIWGSEGLMVPKNMVDVIFGYRKASLAELFDKEDPNAIEKAFVDGVAYTLKMWAISVKGMGKTDAEKFSKQGKAAVRNAEEIWQDIVYEAKDFIVVKTGTVLMGNFLSNMGMLAMKGVPLLKSIKYQHEALKGILDYERDRYELSQLQILVDSGYGNKSMDEVQARMVELKDSIAKNPVKELIDAGLMPTIVEDISLADSPYSYKSQLTHWIDGKTAKLNPHVVRAGKFVYMSHDTLMYKVLSNATRYSDFVARYALFKHQTMRENSPMTKEDAIFEASEAFVNYDIPLPKEVQYLDDMGFLPFIKYFLSIQRVLAGNFKEAPLRVVSVAAMNGFSASLPMPTDSSFVVRMGNNPFSLGALNYPNAVGEAMTMQGGLSLVK